MNPKVEKLLRELGWSTTYIEKFTEAVENIALLYDKEYSSYPEHTHEGCAFLTFCIKGNTPRDYREWQKRIECE